jgi:DNA-binding Xre family transcriptional regulator
MLASKKIKKTLIDDGLSVTELAKIIGYTREHLSGVISGRIKSRRAERLISTALKRKDGELCSSGNSSAS